jgi:hypothetical protein
MVFGSGWTLAYSEAEPLNWGKCLRALKGQITECQELVYRDLNGKFVDMCIDVLQVSFYFICDTVNASHSEPRAPQVTLALWHNW